MVQLGSQNDLATIAGEKWVVKPAYKVNPRYVKAPPATTVTQRQLAKLRANLTVVFLLRQQPTVGQISQLLTTYCHICL